MRFLRRYPWLAILPAIASLGGCDNELLTTNDPGLVPRFETLEAVLPADAVVSEIGAFSGFADPRDAPFLLVANEFDGALTAHALLRFGPFPDSVRFEPPGEAIRTDTVFTYTSGRLVARVDSTGASGGGAPVTLQLSELAQRWDPATVSWTLAVDSATRRVAWEVPGGTPGPLLATATYAPGSAAQGDSVVWQVDSLAVARMAADDFPGLLVTVVETGVRIELGRNPSLRTAIRPASKPDTAIDRTIPIDAQRFIFTPDAPSGPAAWSVGGIGASRLLFRVRIPDTVPCRSGIAACPGSGSIPLRDVSLNRATLVLEPEAVPSGFRPLRPITIALFEVGTPPVGPTGDTLFALTPLGREVARTAVADTLFVSGDAGTVELAITNRIRALDEATNRTLAFALLAAPGSTGFGLARFGAAPRLRIVYTLPIAPELP